VEGLAVESVDLGSAGGGHGAGGIGGRGGNGADVEGVVAGAAGGRGHGELGVGGGERFTAEAVFVVDGSDVDTDAIGAFGDAFGGEGAVGVDGEIGELAVCGVFALLLKHLFAFVGSLPFFQPRLPLVGGKEVEIDGALEG